MASRGHVGLGSGLTVVIFRRLIYCAYVSVATSVFSVCAHAIEANSSSSPNNNGVHQDQDSGIHSSTAWDRVELPVRTWVIILSCVVGFWFFLSLFLAFCCGPKFVECHLCGEGIPRRQWTRHGHWESCAKDHERFISELPTSEHQCPTCRDNLKIWPKGVGPNVFKCQIGIECNHERQKAKRLLAQLKQQQQERKHHQRPHQPPIKGLAFEEKIDPEDLEVTTNQHRPFIDVESNGESRLCCFIDGFDMCDKCADAHHNLTPLQMTATTTATTLNHPAAAFNIPVVASNASNGNKHMGNGGWFDVQLKTISQDVQRKETHNGAVVVPSQRRPS